VKAALEDETCFSLVVYRLYKSNGEALEFVGRDTRRHQSGSRRYFFGLGASANLMALPQAIHVYASACGRANSVSILLCIWLIKSCCLL
jgi:hypothetical protein